MNITTAGIPKDGLPEGFVYIDELIEDAIIDAKYAGTDNFMCCAADGYERPLVVMSREAAEHCIKAAAELRGQGYVMKLFDAYRPARAVLHFARWTEDLTEQKRKPIQYPRNDKARMFELGYMARRSGHSRGSSVDLSIVSLETWQELDMGTCFDFMDEKSHLVTEGLTPQQEENRLILRRAMVNNGFVTYENEWWHFNLATEPYPDTYFDFPIR